MDTAYSTQLHEQRQPTLALAAEGVPVALVLGGATWIAWHSRGSIVAQDFLPVAMLAALAVATVLLSGSARRPSRGALVPAAALAALALWAVASAFWAPVPSLARDEGLLTLAGLVTFAVPLVTLRSERARGLSIGIVAAGIALAALGTVLVLHGSRPIDDVFRYRRLSFPITYANAAAAFFMLGVWPGVALAARKPLHPIFRAAALGTASTSLAAATLAQSKGAAIGLAVSIVAVAIAAPERLRLLLAFGLATAPVAIAFPTLTAPYRAAGSAQPAAVHAAASAVLLAGAAAALGGGAYAVLDGRLQLSGRTRRIAGIAFAALVLLAGLGGSAAFVAHVHHPSAWVASKWRAFKHVTPKNTANTHLLEVGSNRYDFWRVAFDEWKRHPVAGDGARGFGPAYLVYGRSSETPARAHSLPLELLSEEGIVGISFALFAFGTLLASLIRRARRGDRVALTAFAACTLALGHACFDWTFTFPALTLPFFLIAGIGLAGEPPAGPSSTKLGRTTRLAAGGVLVSVAFLVFMPPWVSSKLVRRGVEQRSLADLRWAHRLDPVPVDPWIAEAQLATTPAAAIPPLERARARQPRSVGVRYLLGSVYFNDGQFRAAQREFTAASRIDPRDPLIARALRIARARH